MTNALILVSSSAASVDKLDAIATELCSAQGGWGVGPEWTPPIEKSPLWEPKLDEYFPSMRDYVPDINRPVSTLERVRNVSPEHFAELVSRGQPFVIEDAARGLPLLGKGCDFYAERWPNASMRAEYHDERRTGKEWQIFFDPEEGETKIPLSNPLWWNTQRPAQPRRAMHKHMAGLAGKLSGPYIWHVKDQEPIETKRSVQQHWGVPYFLNESAMNSFESYESFEFWFALPGGGTMAHGDAYCEMTLSMQLKGRKRWRMMMLPPLDSPEHLFNTHDGYIYETDNWVPESETLVSEGEAIIFPPNYMHETYIHPDENDESDCTVATTFQFVYPHSARYLRAFLPRMAMSSLQDEERCVQERWAHLALLDPPSKKAFNGDADHASRVLADMDSDRSGDISYSEFSTFFHESPSRHARWAHQEPYTDGKHHGTSPSPEVRLQMAAEILEANLHNMWSFQDLNRDGLLTAAEIAASAERW
eukprot:CAMPEP_0119301622 /NCGR_PEP_ID=MMETSP1333-20130426/3371_1 /TAXON_ID=418940 /ORGANISM="Scyphosphaera apsteinii, Strain RCC1455" /LENGTH=476 /DNA_ID=CAMNT_0007303745 /DNA_START=17 /DNA_END=1444 /DNA_ORIENTATION=-